MTGLHVALREYSIGRKAGEHQVRHSSKRGGMQTSWLHSFDSSSCSCAQDCIFSKLEDVAAFKPTELKNEGNSCWGYSWESLYRLVGGDVCGGGGGCHTTGECDRPAPMPSTPVVRTPPSPLTLKEFPKTRSICKKSSVPRLRFWVEAS